MEDLHEKLKKELEEELKEHQAKLDGIDRIGSIITGWLITIMILMLIDPELTKNEFFVLCLIISTIMGLYGIFSNNLKGD